MYQHTRLSDTSAIAAPGPLPAPHRVARSIRIRTVPRVAVEALVARLAAQGFRHIATSEGSPYGG